MSRCHSTAVAAIGCLVIERECCSLKRLVSARFAGPPRAFPRGTRPTLVIDAGNREVKPRCLESEADDDGIFSRLVDGFYLAASRTRGRAPFHLFERKDGVRRASCGVSTMISQFTEACGHAMCPLVLRERAVLLAKRRRDLDAEALRDLVDASTTDNARFRYRFLERLDVVATFSKDNT